MKGIVSRYGFAVSNDGKKWREVALGEFSNIKNNPVEQRVSFSPIKAKYIRLRAIQTVDGELAAFAELGVITGEGGEN